MNKISLSLCCMLFVLAGCAPSVNMEDFKPSQMEKSNVSISKENSKPRVAVLDFEDMSSSGGNGKVAAENIESLLFSSNIVKVVDKTLVMQNRSTASTNADYIISGEMTNSSSNIDIQPARTTCDQSGQCTNIPAKCVKKANISGFISIYSTADYSVIKKIALNGNVSSTLHTEYCSRDTKALLKDATAKAVNNAKVEILNFFSPKGYIIEKRVKSDGSAIFLASFGLADGIKFNDNVKLFSVTQAINPVTNKKINNDIYLGEGKVTDKVTQNSCWIYVENKAIADKLRVDDYAKIEFERGVLDSIYDIAN